MSSPSLPLARSSVTRLVQRRDCRSTATRPADAVVYGWYQGMQLKTHARRGGVTQSDGRGRDSGGGGRQDKNHTTLLQEKKISRVSITSNITPHHTVIQHTITHYTSHITIQTPTENDFPSLPSTPDSATPLQHAISSQKPKVGCVSSILNS